MSVHTLFFISRTESFSATDTIKSSTPSVKRIVNSRRAGGGGGSYAVSRLSALRLPLAFSLSGSMMKKLWGASEIETHESLPLSTHRLRICQIIINS